MSAPRIYLAGPDLFFPDAAERYARLKAACAHAGLIGVEPNEGLVHGLLTGMEEARRIYEHDMRTLQLHPTGEAFLDLCLWKGRFPSRKAQFCTQELKRDMAVGHQLDLIEQGYRVISWQGVRRDESENRKNAKRMERIGPRLWAFRPIVEWTAVQVFSRHASHGITPNPLYRQGMGRVGCMPCINVNKAELREISMRFPAHIDRIAKWEWMVGQASKRGYSTMMADAHDAKDRRQIFADLNIRARVEWSKTSRGGKQIDLFADEPPSACASAYGLCDGGG